MIFICFFWIGLPSLVDLAISWSKKRNYWYTLVFRFEKNEAFGCASLLTQRHSAWLCRSFPTLGLQVLGKLCIQFTLHIFIMCKFLSSVIEVRNSGHEPLWLQISQLSCLGGQFRLHLKLTWGCRHWGPNHENPHHTSKNIGILEMRNHYPWPGKHPSSITISSIFLKWCFLHSTCNFLLYWTSRHEPSSRHPVSQSSRDPCQQMKHFF